MPLLSKLGRSLIFIAVLMVPAYANKPLKTVIQRYTVVNCCDSQGLTVFPFVGNAFTIPLPFIPRTVAFGPKGNSLYAIKPSGDNRVGGSNIVRIEFHPTRVIPVWESSNLEISSFAVSLREDKLVISGSPRDGAERTCGMFEIILSPEEMRRILETSDCRFGATWSEISLSSDGERAVANVGRDMKLIDLVHGTVKSLGSEFSRGVWSSGAAWSPDGKWIAVMESRNRGRVVLLDPSDLSRRRALHSGYHRMTPVWSPESRYLVRSRLQLRCGIGIADDPSFTLEMVDVESGKRTLIRSSRCKMDGGGTGWLSSDLVQ